MKVVLAFTIALVLLVGGFAKADNASDAAKENEQLRQRVDKLEKELAELKEMLLQRTAPPSRPAEIEKPKPPVVVQQPVKPQAPIELSEAQMRKIAEMAGETNGKKSVWSNLDIQLYGYIKADASYDTSRTHPGNYVVWADSESTKSNDNEFNMTANQTRLGMLINGPDGDAIKASGRLEFDFYGNYASENKAKIQMRHAYMKWLWKDCRTEILAGQTSDVISPLNPSTLNYTVLWDVGNIGYRRPQIRLTKWVGLGQDTELKLEGAIARTIGRTSTLVTPNSESGEDAGFPTFQARIGLTTPIFGKRPTTVGVSSHWGQEEYDITAAGDNKIFDTWSLNLDIEQPIFEWLKIKTELFTGANLNEYFGGIGQGVNTDTTKTRFYNEIESKGGWIAASLGPWDKKEFNIGIGIDDVDSSDLNTGDRSRNQCIFGNMIHSFNKQMQAGIEISHWRTQYVGPGDADAIRAQTSLIYKF